MAWRVEAVLLATGPDGKQVPIGRTVAPGAVADLGSVLIGEARAEALALRRLDPLLGRLGAAEASRLAAILRMVTPRGDATDPALQLVPR